MKNKKVKKVVHRHSDGQDSHETFPSKTAALAAYNLGVAKVMSDSSIKINELRETPPCTMGDINAITTARDEILGRLAENYQNAVIIRPRKKAKKKVVKKAKRVRSRKRKMTYAELRKAVINHYGGPKCTHCGQTKPPFYLQHIDSEGSNLRLDVAGIGKSARYNAALYYRWLMANDYPKKHNQIVLCKASFGLLKYKRRTPIELMQPNPPELSPFMKLNPVFLDPDNAAIWCQFKDDYRHQCVLFWEQYLDNLHREAIRHTK